MKKRDQMPDCDVQIISANVPESQVRFCLSWTLLNEVCVRIETSFILWLLAGNVGMLACLPY